MLNRLSHPGTPNLCFKVYFCLGHLGAQSVVSNFSTGHYLVVCQFEPHIRICADSSAPGACFRFCVSLSSLPPLMLCLSLKNKLTLKKSILSDLMLLSLLLFCFHLYEICFTIFSLSVCIFF